MTMIQDSPQVTVFRDRCAGCEECLVRCPVGAIALDEGSWTVTVDNDVCIGCHQCERTCPFSAITVEGMPKVAPRTQSHEELPAQVVGSLSEVRLGFVSDEELVAEASRCLDCPDPTCMRGCPTHNNIPTFIALARELDFNGARRVLLETSAMPEVCSRVCDSAIQCEGSCSLALAGDKPVAVHEIERYIADHASLELPRPEEAGLTVACIGSGPASIGAAEVFARGGAKVTIFERAEVSGGLLRFGIPEFTLPGRVVDGVFERLERLGVDVVNGYEVEVSSLSELKSQFDLVVVGAGATTPIPAPAKGKESVGFTEANDFLEEAQKALEAKSFDPARGPQLLVLGAGNTAMDVARLSRRLGGTAICVDWMDRQFSVVRPDELADAVSEGVEVLFGVTVSEVAPAEGGKITCTLVKTVQKDAATRPSVTGEVARVVTVDKVVQALGFRLSDGVRKEFPALPVPKAMPVLADRHWTASGIFAGVDNDFSRKTKVGELALKRDRARQRAGIPATSDGVYVAGDSLVGPSTVVEAMAHGRRVAAAALGQRGRLAVSTVGRGRAPRVLVVFESPGGTTKSWALAVAEGLANFTDTVVALPVDQVEAIMLADFDVVVFATWVDGMVVAKQSPGKAMLELIDSLVPHTRVLSGVMCTYQFDPGQTLKIMEERLAAKDIRTVASVAISHREKGSGPAAFMRELGEGAWPAFDANGALKQLLELPSTAANEVVGPRDELLEALVKRISERKAVEGADFRLTEVQHQATELQSTLDRLRRLRRIPS